MDICGPFTMDTWNAMFSCYVQSESCGEAVGSFKEMVRSGIGPKTKIKFLNN